MTDNDTQASSLPLSPGSTETLGAESTPPWHSVEKGRALRQRLEQLLTPTPTAPSLAETGMIPLAEVRQTLHELEAHQVELETEIEELRRRQAQLDAARERACNICNLMPAGYVAVNEQGRILEANFHAATLLGVDRQALVNQPISPFIFNEDQGAYAFHQQQLLATGEPQTCELRIAGQGTALRWIRLGTSTAQQSCGGPLTRMLFTDITESKQAAALQLEMERTFQQSQKLENLGVLAGRLAHDFSNMLAIILGQCDILSDDLNSAETIAHVKHIEKAALKAVDRCEQMSTYLRNNAPIHTRINLRLLVEETVKQFQPTLKRTIRIECDRNDEVFEITGDHAQIRQAIMNLCCNAAEAIGEQKGAITLALNRRSVGEDPADRDVLGNAIQAGEYACLTVTDNGGGMDAETQKRLFEPFYTTKFPGRGLGLSAVLGSITAQNGALQFSTTPGKGTTFKVFFPLVAVAENAPAPPAAPATDIPPDKGRGTLLLVDDEAPLRIIGSALLKAMGFTVMIAAGGREAIDIHGKHSHTIDLILLDLLMPEMGGIETYRHLRQISPTIPIIICSEGNAEGLAQDFTDDPLAEAVQKPYKPDQLRNVFMQLIETMG